MGAPPGTITEKTSHPWVLFTFFVFGPCEPLIPILMYPAATSAGLGYTALVAGVFAVVTIGTMMTLVLSASIGLKAVPPKGLQRYSHAIAGFTILLCGGAKRSLAYRITLELLHLIKRTM